MHELHKQVEALITSNHEPSEEVIREVRRLLREPINELKDLDSEMQRLRDRREMVSTTINRYHPIFAPIRRLPLDVLFEIFTHCLPEDHNPIISAAEAPILLTHICGSWRSFALSSPRLWSRIHAPFTNQDLLHDNPRETTNRIPQARVVQILRRRCEAVDQWLLRSGRSPLSISMHYKDAAFRRANSPLSEISIDFCKILASVSDRWQHMEMNLPVQIYNQLVNGLDSARFPKLTTLRISFLQEYWEHRPKVDQLWTRILKSQNLKKLSINIPLPALTSDWANITSLSIHRSVPLAPTADLLTKCPALLHFKITLERTPGGSRDTQNELPSTPIHLPHLRTLYITDRIKHESNRFYDAIDAPELRFISYTTVPIGDDMAPIVVAVTALLRKSTKLETMRLHTDNYGNKEMRELLHSASGVTKFAYGPDRRSGPVPELVGNMIAWDFSDLFIPLRSNEIALTGLTLPTESATDGPLLPLLETLELSPLKDIPRFSEANLVHFIISRMDASSSLSSLRHIDVEFYRPKRWDIERHVQNYAKRLGITHNIKLDLTYHSTPVVQQKEYHPTDADYGLHHLEEKARKLWNQDRIDEQVGLLIYPAYFLFD